MKMGIGYNGGTMILPENDGEALGILAGACIVLLLFGVWYLRKD